MLRIDEIRSTIIRNLKLTTGITTIVAEQSSEQPPYPFVTVKFTTLGKKVGRVAQYMKDDGQYTEQDIEMILSVTSFSADTEDEIDQATDNAYKALQFFEVNGIEVLQDNNIAVVETTELTNRDTFISIEYERRAGFDVRIRTRAQLVKEIDTIEAVNINNNNEEE